MSKSWRESYTYPVRQLQKEIGFTDSKILWLVASGQLNVEKDVHGDLFTCWADAYYYLTLPNSYRIEQINDTHDYLPSLKSMGRLKS